MVLTIFKRWFAFSKPSTFCFTYINTPTAEMRAQASAKSEVLSQALFAERVRLIEFSGNWAKIETLVDQYQGWVKKSELCHRKEAYLSGPDTLSVKSNRSAAHLYTEQDTIFGPILTIPFECHLRVLDEAHDRWIKVLLPDERLAYIQRGDISFNSKLLSREEICALSLRFMDLPYTWGGRSSFGYDCSGFVQMLYRHMGVYLPRDSKDQYRWKGFIEVPLKQVSAGDLVFWGIGENGIRHVGMCLDQDQFIHTSAVTQNAPYVRISKLTEEAWNGNGYYPYLAARKLK